MILKDLKINKPIFFGSSALIWVMLFFAIFFKKTSEIVFTQLYEFITVNFSWWYISCVAMLLLFSLFLMLSRFGDIRFGEDHEKAEFGFGAWMSMLFSAGMGIGLLFYGVAEPVLHYSTAPSSPGARFGEASHALKTTFFHWGIHAWSIYIVVGGALAYFTYRKGLPMSIRYTLKPLIGDQVDGPLGWLIDILAVLGTIFGVATSLGLGVTQINSGLSYLTDIPNNVYTQLFLIAFITLFATISVVTGIKKGIKLLSQANIVVAVILLSFIFIEGPTIRLLNLYVENIGIYLQGLPNVTFHTSARNDTPWMGTWTLFYWGWWIAWAPFVGTFIARISRGRTIREFVAGVLIVPTLATFFWFTVFGETAIALIEAGHTDIVTAVQENLPVALFVFLEKLPLTTITSSLSVLVIFTFFITSSDSGSYVIDMITSGGALNPPTIQKIYWAFMEGAIAAVLLVMGGLQALQTATINVALPFSFITVLMAYCLYKSIREEREEARALREEQIQEAISSN